MSEPTAFRLMRLMRLASYLPDRALMFLHRRLPDAYTGTAYTGTEWTLWMDASYLKWCRRDMRKRGVAS